VKTQSERAPRFALQLPVRYRAAGEQWHEGRIENISRSGMLFWARHPLDIDVPLEMSFVLPVGPQSLGIVCRGRIVRSAPTTRRSTVYVYGLAATISVYRFVRAVHSAA
jgi:hypothetical protein